MPQGAFHIRSLRRGAVTAVDARSARTFARHSAGPNRRRPAEGLLHASLEVADIFRTAGAGYRAAQAGHLSLDQLKVISAIQNCRTAALGGHVEGCDDCGHLRVAYNSCRNRHCPKCQGAAARTWLAERQADLLPVGYFHVVFTLPAEVADLAWQNKAAVYDLLFRAASETMMTIAADPRHLGARIELKAASVQILVDHPANEADPLPLLLTGYPQATGLPAKAICCG